MYRKHSNYVWVAAVCMTFAACALGAPDVNSEPSDIEVESLGQSLGPAVALGAISAPIINPATSFCLDVLDASTSNGARVQTYYCHGESNQKWYYNGRTGEVRDANSGLCLDVVGGVIGDGSAVQMYECLGSDNQRWGWRLNGALTVRGPQGLSWCLDVPGFATTPTQLQVWRCQDTDNQVWMRPSRALRNAASGRCLDVKTQDGYTVQSWDCNGGSNQQWVQEQGAVWRSQYNSRLLIVHDFSGLTVNAGNLPGWPEIFHRPDGTLGLIAADFGWEQLCLEGDDWHQPNGTRAKFVNCNGSAKQIWLVQ